MFATEILCLYETVIVFGRIELLQIVSKRFPLVDTKQKPGPEAFSSYNTGSQITMNIVRYNTFSSRSIFFFQSKGNHKSSVRSVWLWSSSVLEGRAPFDHLTIVHSFIFFILTKGHDVL